MGFITKQPNGLYCRFSTVVDCPTDWNMTEEDYIEMCAEKAKREARRVLKNHLRPFEEVIEEFYPHSMTVEKFHKVMRDMGYDGELHDEEYYDLSED